MTNKLYQLLLRLLYEHFYGNKPINKECKILTMDKATMNFLKTITIMLLYAFNTFYLFYVFFEIFMIF